MEINESDLKLEFNMTLGERKNFLIGISHLQRVQRYTDEKMKPQLSKKILNYLAKTNSRKLQEVNQDEFFLEDIEEEESIKDSPFQITKTFDKPDVFFTSPLDLEEVDSNIE